MPQLIQTREVQEQIVPARLSSQREVGSSGEGRVVRRKEVSAPSSLLLSQFGNTLHNCSFGFLVGRLKKFPHCKTVRIKNTCNLFEIFLFLVEIKDIYRKVWDSKLKLFQYRVGIFFFPYCNKKCN